MNMKEAFPNLKFVDGEGKVQNFKLTEQQCEIVEKFKDDGKKAGEQLKTFFCEPSVGKV